TGRCDSLAPSWQPSALAIRWTGRPSSSTVAIPPLVRKSRDISHVEVESRQEKLGSAENGQSRDHDLSSGCGFAVQVGSKPEGGAGDQSKCQQDQGNRCFERGKREVTDEILHKGPPKRVFDILDQKG